MRGFKNQGTVRRDVRYESCWGEMVPASTARIPNIGTTAHHPSAMLQSKTRHCSLSPLRAFIHRGFKPDDDDMEPQSAGRGTKRTAHPEPDKGVRTIRQKSINAYLQDGSGETRARIKEGLERASDLTPPDLSSMQSVLSRIPHTDRLARLGSASVPQISNVEVIPKDWEDSFLLPPKRGERPCIAGERCESLELAKDKGMPQPFIMKEFFTPSEQHNMTEKPPRPHMCLLCHRREVMIWYWKHATTKSEPPCVLNRWRNICGVPGNYSEDSVIMQAGSRWRGVVGCFVRHNRDAFRMEIPPEGPRLVQIGVGFQIPPAL